MVYLTNATHVCPLDSLKLAQTQFLPLCQSWNYEDWDEYDYGRIKSLKFRELEEARKKEGQNAVAKHCLECPNFLKHASPSYAMFFSITDLLVLHGA